MVEFIHAARRAATAKGGEPVAKDGRRVPEDGHSNARLQALAATVNGNKGARKAVERTEALSLARGAGVPAPAVQRRKEGERAPAANRTGLPDQLKAGAEALSGHSLDDVRVHRNSSRPADVEAEAFAQGSEIHLGPGQEKHLPHEAWHVVQQKQGRVRPTIQMKGAAINDDSGLEAEADRKGAEAAAFRQAPSRADARGPDRSPLAKAGSSAEPVVQRGNGKDEKKKSNNKKQEKIKAAKAAKKKNEQRKEDRAVQSVTGYSTSKAEKKEVRKAVRKVKEKGVKIKPGHLSEDSNSKMNSGTKNMVDAVNAELGEQGEKEKKEGREKREEELEFTRKRMAKPSNDNNNNNNPETDEDKI